jgi:hypothetical protein
MNMAKIVIEGWRPVRADWKNLKPVPASPPQWSESSLTPTQARDQMRKVREIIGVKE